jgi:hypothetical protein
MKFYAAIREGKAVDFKRRVPFREADCTPDVSGKLRKAGVKI